MNETQEPTLESLKVGDVAYVRGAYTAPLRKVTIKKITATQVVDNRDNRYSIEKNGRSTQEAGKWDVRDYLLPATPEIVAQYERQQNISLVRACKWETMSDETLAAVAAILLRGE